VAGKVFFFEKKNQKTFIPSMYFLVLVTGDEGNW